MTACAVVASALLVLVAARPWRPAPPRRIVRSERGRARRTVAVDRGSARNLGVAGAAVLGSLVGGPVVAVLAAVAAAGAGPAIEHRRARRRKVAVAGAVPDLVDLFLVSASAGQTVAGSLAVVGPRAPTPVAGVVRAACDQFGRGLPLAECLSELGSELGQEGRPLADALHQAAAAGVPLVPLLEGVAAAARDHRRRRAQQVARRLPVTMLFPMVACILPAAVLLAVVPVLLVSVSSLSR